MVRSVEMRSHEVSPFEMCAGEVGTLEVRARKTGLIEVYAPKVGSLEACSSEIRFSQMRAGKMQAPRRGGVARDLAASEDSKYRLGIGCDTRSCAGRIAIGLLSYRCRQDLDNGTLIVS